MFELSKCASVRGSHIISQQTNNMRKRKEEDFTSVHDIATLFKPKSKRQKEEETSSHEVIDPRTKQRFDDAFLAARVGLSETQFKGVSSLLDGILGKESEKPREVTEPLIELALALEYEFARELSEMESLYLGIDDACLKKGEPLSDHCCL
jgi:hypothetical protein